MELTKSMKATGTLTVALEHRILRVMLNVAKKLRCVNNCDAEKVESFPQILGRVLAIGTL